MSRDDHLLSYCVYLISFSCLIHLTKASWIIIGKEHVSLSVPNLSFGFSPSIMVLELDLFMNFIVLI